MAYASAAEAEAKAHAERVAANKAASAKRDAERAAAKAAAAKETVSTPDAPETPKTPESEATANAASATTSAAAPSSSGAKGVPCDGCDCGLEAEGSAEGTVGEFDLHLLVHSGAEGASWAPRLEEEDSALGTLLRALADAAKATGVKAKITAIDAPSDKPDSFDVTVWPHGHVYHAASPANAKNLLSVLADDKAPVARVVQLLMRPQPVADKPHVYVCVHAARDQRCGTRGAAVYESFKKNVGESAVVSGTSHVGGHKYAGNVIVYPAGAWYGYVCPDVAADMSAALAKGQSLDFPERRRGHVKWAQKE